MAELIVIGYASEAKAEEARNDLFQMAKEYLIDVGDAVVATADDKGKVKLNQMVHLWSIGATTGAFWGLLIGLLFLSPLFGVLAGAAAGAVSGALNDYGINDDFMKNVAKVLKPGHAALFIMARQVNSDRVISELATHGGEVLRTNLDTGQEHKLREAFAKAQAAASEQQKGA
ncbi:MAG: DUF1269 domain-containing protein [Alphaproteobacteria bacterium]|nr:DUF1269 domain-containing protein [Alphaproteobacteria bacterium]MCB9929227.1 DUF1269 domain-containing protein [Alphaproteobacteria bacterium]